MANSVDPEAMAAAARNLSTFKEIFARTLANSEYLANQYRMAAFGTDTPGKEMLVQYDELAAPLWDNASGFDNAVGRVGLTAEHSANAWNATSEAPPNLGGRPPTGTGEHPAPAVGEHPAPGHAAPAA